MKEGTYSIAVPPGATIKEQLEYRKKTQKEFSDRMGMSEKHVSRLMNGEAELTIECARKLELVLGLPAVFWCNLEAHYRDRLAEVTKENEMDEDIEISGWFRYGEMASFGVPQMGGSGDASTPIL